MSRSRSTLSVVAILMLACAHTSRLAAQAHSPDPKDLLARGYQSPAMRLESSWDFGAGIMAGDLKEEGLGIRANPGIALSGGFTLAWKTPPQGVVLGAALQVDATLIRREITEFESIIDGSWMEPPAPASLREVVVSLAAIIGYSFDQADFLVGYGPNLTLWTSNYWDQFDCHPVPRSGMTGFLRLRFRRLQLKASHQLNRGRIARDTPAGFWYRTPFSHRSQWLILGIVL